MTVFIIFLAAAILVSSYATSGPFAPQTAASGLGKSRMQGMLACSAALPFSGAQGRGREARPPVHSDPPINLAGIRALHMLMTSLF